MFLNFRTVFLYWYISVSELQGENSHGGLRPEKVLFFFVQDLGGDRLREMII